MARYTLRQVEYFCAVVRAGTLSGAAEAERISRSALASGLDELEKSLGVKLFRRQRSAGVELTTKGLAFLDGALELLRFSDDLAARVSEEALQGQLHIGCFSSLAPTVLPLLMQEYGGLYPQVSIIVEADSQDRIMRHLISGELELAVMYAVEEWPHLNSIELFEAQMHIIVGRDHSLAASPAIDVTALGIHPLILLDTPPSAEAGLRYLNAHGIVPHISYRTSHFEFARSLVARGLGFSMFIQQPSSGQSYEGHEVVIRPVVPAPPPVNVSVYWPKERALSARGKRFIELAQHHAAELSPLWMRSEPPES